jgi:hypothetical protein
MQEVPPAWSKKAWRQQREARAQSSRMRPEWMSIRWKQIPRSARRAHVSLIPDCAQSSHRQTSAGVTQRREVMANQNNREERGGNRQEGNRQEGMGNRQEGGNRQEAGNREERGGNRQEAGSNREERGGSSNREDRGGNR